MPEHRIRREFHKPFGRRATVSETPAGEILVALSGPGLETEEERAETLDDGVERAEHWVNGKPTNVEVLVGLMTTSENAPLIQGFVITTLLQQAEKVAAAKPEEVGTTLIDGRAWHACASEVRDTLQAHLA